MDCLQCSTQLVAVDQLFFFCKSEKDVHLSIKPEFEGAVRGSKTIESIRESKKKMRVKCCSCDSNVGVVLPFGPGGTSFYAFGVDKVCLNGNRLSKTKRWWDTYKEFPKIQPRDMNNFFNLLTVKLDVEREKPKEEYGRIVFPSLSNLTDFEWFSVSLVKKPKTYQIEAFIEGLQRNLIVVLKTGGGKTLIASMLLGRMCALNPDRMGLLIVDRIPLVFQQGNAIYNDTNLSIARVCGENRTARTIKRVNDGEYDILVCTAGCFFEMVQRKEMHVDLFCAVVFDECHHAAGGHKYMDVLRLFTKKALVDQPRIMGLTASLFSAQTLTQAENRLNKYMANFPNAKIYHPNVTKGTQSVQRITVRLSPIQREFIEDLVNKLNPLLCEICKIAHVPVADLQMQSDLLNSYHIVGYLRSLEERFVSSHDFYYPLKIAYVAIEGLELCSTLGIEAAIEVLQEHPKFEDIVEKYEDSKQESDRLKQLVSLLKNVSSDSKILIFVSTKNLARPLWHVLVTLFPHFNAEKVFGHAGYDGMGWEGQGGQAEVLAEFRSGKCNLIISTSILEEGLDVSACDLVICFTGVKTLIQFIQCRGRARKENSQFVIFESEEEKNRTSRIESEEEMFSAVLKINQQSHCYFSDLSKDIMKRVEEGMIMGGVKDSEDLLLNEKKKGSEFTFNMHLGVIDGMDKSSVKRKILEVLDDFNQYFKVNRIDVVNTSVDLEFFSPEVVTTFLIGAISLVTVGNDTAYTEFCHSFEFEIEINGIKLKIWTQQHDVYNEVDKITSVKSTGYKAGFLRDKTSATVRAILKEEEITVQFTPNKYIEIINDDYLLKIPLGSIGKFSLITIDKHEFTLIIPLSYPPLLYRSRWDRQNRKFIYDKRVHINDIGDVAVELQHLAFNPVLFITFDKRKLNDIRRITSSHSLFPVHIFDAKIKMSALEADSTSINNIPPNLNFVMYTVKCIHDSRLISYPLSFPEDVMEFIGQQTSVDSGKEKEILHLAQLVVDKLYNLVSKGQYFLDIANTFSTIFREFSSIPVGHRGILSTPVPENFFLLKRVIITPSRNVALPPVPVASNRLLRLLSSSEEYKQYDIIIVSFKDEDMSKLVEVDAFKRVKLVVNEGIEINGKKYEYLLSSGSQLRESKAFYISCSYENVLNIRHKLIPDFRSFKSMAKYLSRLGQYATGDAYVCKLSADHITWIEDIRAHNNDMTTDGAGKISMSFAEELATLKGIELPSAFQIRYSGVKGILLCCPDTDPDFQGKPICFRKSQNKFTNDDEDLCIVGVSRIYDLTLNREAITLLSAINCDWALKKTLLNYQESCLAENANMFKNERSAKNALKQVIPTGVIDKLHSCNFSVIEEKYWFSILQGIYRMRVLDLRNKTNIPIEEGCILMGVPDPSGLLKDNEVFVQLKEDSGTEIKCCPALIYRNPCLHPGDQRRVSCVDIVELHYLHNVIVFPVNNCTFSLASACSGGDLDGDKFSVIWDPLLVPGEEFVYPPCNYTELAYGSPVLSGSSVTDKNKIAEFYINVITNDCLGRVAHVHLALCDMLTPNGARDLLAIELSKSQAQAVDFPKTGILPEVPKEALDKVKEYGFPDFMGKAYAESYQSKKVIGDLYRRCISVGFDFNFFSRAGVDNFINMNMVVEGSEEYLEDAVKVYNSYMQNMDMLMGKFQLKVEADVVLGYATFGWGEFFQGDHGKASDTITASYHALVERYRNIFFSDVNDDESQKMKASAWYRVVNDPEIKLKNMKSDRELFLSFPWVVQDVLCEIMSEQNSAQPSRINYCIGKNSLELFLKSSSILEKHVTEKIKVMKDITNAINHIVKENYCVDSSVFLVELYGSTSIYLCEPDSDADINVYAKPEVYESSLIPEEHRESFKNSLYTEKQKYLLQLVVSPAVDTIVSSKEELLDRKNPIIKCVSNENENPIHCDISMNEIGLRKTLYIHYLYDLNAWYLPLFWILVRWARIKGVVKSAGESSPLMDTADFYALIIYLLDCPKQENSAIENISRSTGLKHLLHCLDKLRFSDIHNLGSMIYTFFREASHLDDNLVIAWPADDIPSIQLDKSTLEMVADIAKNSLHCLLPTRKVETLHSFPTTNQSGEMQKLLPLSMSYAIGKAHAFHAARLTRQTGAQVSIEPAGGNSNLLLKATGSPMALDNLRLEIRSMLMTNKALTLGRVPQKSSRYFMEGSTIVMVQGGSSVQTLCTFEGSLGPYEILHYNADRKYLLLKRKRVDIKWKEKGMERFLSHISKQMECFPKEENLIQSIEVTSRFGCFNLINLSSHLPDAKTTITLLELQCSLDKGRMSRKAWERERYLRNPRIEEEPIVEEPSFEMRTLGRSSGFRFAEKVGKTLKKMKSNKKGIAAAFSPGLLKLNSEDASVRNNLLMVYRQALAQCGFKEGASGSRRPCHWKIVVSPSASFEGHIMLNEDMSLMKLEERCVNWVHGTIVSGKKQSFKGSLQESPDLRLIISSTDAIKEDSDLYRDILPIVDGEVVLPIILEDGRPVINPILSKRRKQITNTVRHNHTIEMFTNGMVDASVLFGDNYTGENLSLHRPVCDLNLYFSPEPLANCIRNNIGGEPLKKFADDFFETSIRLQEVVENLITTLGD